MSRVLIIRLSSIGDVAMTVPVIYSVAKSNHEDAFTVLTQTFLKPLFVNRPENVAIMGIDTVATENTLWRLARYAFRLSKYQFDEVLDLHGVLRSWVIDAILFACGKKVFVINKNRKERKQITVHPPKAIYPLRSVTERYADVFRAAGFRYKETFVSLFEDSPAVSPCTEEKKGKWIGIAPFAKHKGKIYPLETMEAVVRSLSKRGGTTVFLFGGGRREAEILEEWAGKYPEVRNVSNRYTLDGEIALMSQLDMMISMDSANMHLASIAGTKVLSIWGATHPYAGFYGYRQREDNAIQTDLLCRPCSIYGEKPCHRGDGACMRRITPEQIIGAINQQIETP